MAVTYSTYEAKAKFSEVMRKVRAGQRVVIAYRGEEVAEIRPLEGTRTTLQRALARLEDHGLLSRHRARVGSGWERAGASSATHATPWRVTRYSR